MNTITLIGNLTRDPETRTLEGGKAVCNFTLAVNGRKRADGTQETEFFRVAAWDKLGVLCQQYLSKGRKAAVVGPVTARAYAGNDGQPRASLEVTAREVEFLSPRGETAAAPAPEGFVPAEDGELPF